MIFVTHRERSPRLPVFAVVAIALVYLLAGIASHDPWKSEDAIHIGIAHGFASNGNWLLPQIGGEPWAHTAPLYHWTAALLGKLLAGVLEFHNAARLATAVYGAIFLLALAGTAHSLYGKAASLNAILLAIGTLGLLAPLHEAQPAAAGLSCAALAYRGAALVLENRRYGAWLMGIGIGIALPAHGLVGLLMAAPVLLASTFSRRWHATGVALLVALPLMAIWPVMLIMQSPEAWTNWWRNEIAETFINRGLPDIGHVEQLAWAAWPILPIALWSLWLNKKTLGHPVLPLAGTLLGFLWYLSGPNRTLNLLPLLLPLTLLAAAGADRLRRGAANAFDWFGFVTFTSAASLIWLGAAAQSLNWPPRIARNFEKLAPGHEAHYALPVLIFGLLLTLVWLLSWRLPRASWRPSLRWAAGMTLMWSLTSCFWLSWLDHAKSYRQPVLALKAALPAEIDCIERVGIGAAQRASLDYFAGIRTMAAGKENRSSCHWRLSIDDKNRKLPAGWVTYWQGQRPSDRDERWYLDRRNH